MMLRSLSWKGVGTFFLFVIALSACVTEDVLTILEKRRTPATRLEIEVEGKRANAVPARLTDIHLRYIVDGDGIGLEGGPDPGLRHDLASVPATTVHEEQSKTSVIARRRAEAAEELLDAARRTVERPLRVLLGAPEEDPRRRGEERRELAPEDAR